MNDLNTFGNRLEQARQEEVLEAIQRCEFVIFSTSSGARLCVLEVAKNCYTLVSVGFESR